jgi:hypothetical protein
MKKIIILIVLVAAAIGGGYMAARMFFGNAWDGTWWGVQDAGLNWSGDNIRNLETFTFTENGDTIEVNHLVQRGAKEVKGDLTGTGTVDGGRLTITPADGGKPVTFSYNRVKDTIETSLTNADGTPVTLKKLDNSNNSEMEQIRSEIVEVSKNPANKIDTTIGKTKE